MTKFDWTFTAHDNGGGHQVIKVKAASKQEAIEKGFKTADKKAKGDITSWTCRLVIKV